MADQRETVTIPAALLRSLVVVSKQQELLANRFDGGESSLTNARHYYADRSTQLNDELGRFLSESGQYAVIGGFVKQAIDEIKHDSAIEIVS